MTHFKSTTQRPNLIPQRAFTLIELAIVVLIIGLVLAGAIQLTTSAQQGRGDQVIATDMRTVTNAVQRLINDNQAYWLDPAGSSPFASASKPPANCITTGAPICKEVVYPDRNDMTNTTGQLFSEALLKYLPPGFLLKNSDGTPIYKISISRFQDIKNAYNQDTAVFRAIVVRKPDQNLSDARLSRIASLMGTQGGVIANSSTGNDLVVQGNNGAWTARASTDFNFPTGAGNGQVQAGSLVGYTILDAVQMNTNQISRVRTGNDEANTMRADLNMGAQAVTDAAFLGMRSVQSVGGSTIAVNTSCVSTTSSAVNVIAYKANDTTPELEFSVPNEKMHNAIVTNLADHKLYQCQLVGSNWKWAAVSPLVAAHNYVYGEHRDAFSHGWTLPGIGGQPSNLDGQLITNKEAKDAICTAFPSAPPNRSVLSAGTASVLDYTQPCRQVNTWFNNSSSTPIQLTISVSDDDLELAVFIIENYATHTLFDVKMVGQLAVDHLTGDSAGDRALTVTIPPGARYAVSQDRNYSNIEVWNEYR